MDLKEIRKELRKLLVLAEGWGSLQSAPPVERDMALEKLRALYDALRFSPIPRPVVGRTLPERAASKAPRTVVPGVRTVADDEASEFEMVDLSEVLSLGESEETEEFADAAAPASPAEEEFLYDESEGPEIIEFEPEPERVVRRAPKTAPAPQPEVAPAAVENPAPVVEEPAAAPAPAPEPNIEEPAQPEPAPALFDGEDEATVRHRHKQRVIRALYDSDPAAASRAAADAAPAFSDPEPEIADEAFGAAAAPGQPEKKPLRTHSHPGTAESEIVLLDTLTEEPVGESRRPADSEEQTGPLGPVDFSGIADTDAAAPQILGEVIKPGVQTLADTIAPASRRYGAPITDLRQAIGINDKFLMIRDLFGGDSALFDSTIEALNGQESLDDCMIYIAENFAWNPESESAALIMELLERKFA